jgi:hypothetical protein
VYSSWETIEQTYAQLKDWFWGFYSAQTEADLEAAGKHFADGFSKGGVFVLQLFVTHKALKFASAKLVARFPPPEKLKARFQEEQRRAAEWKEGKAEPAREAERVKAAEQKKRGEIAAEQKALQKLKELRRTMEGYGGAELGRDVAGNLPDPSTVGNVVLLGLIGVATVGLVTLVVASANEDEKARRR